MIDLALLRDEPELVRRSQIARGNAPETVDAAIEADRSRRDALNAFETLRAEQNAFGKTVAKAPKDEKAALVAQAKDLADRVKAAPPAARRTSSSCVASATCPPMTSSRAITSSSARCSAPSTWSAA